MKYTVFYERKLRVAAYDMLTIGLSMEFDETTSLGDAYQNVKGMVEKWIEEEQDRLLDKKVPRPKEELK